MRKETPARAPRTPLGEIECFVLDMDGTINLGETVIDGALEFVRMLRTRGISFCFFTNNSSKSPKAYIEKLHRLGFVDVTRSDVMTSGDVMIDYLKRQYGDGARVYLAGTPELEEQFREAGFDLADEECCDAACAVLGFDTTFCFEKADCLCRLVKSGVPFYATNIDRVCPLEEGRFLPDCGSMAAMITHATGVEPVFVGKPSRLTVDYILRRTGAAPERTAMVGDRLYTDIKTAVNGGTVGIAVLSGEITEEDIAASDIEPHYVLDSVRDITEEIERGREAAAGR